MWLCEYYVADWWVSICRSIRTRSPHNTQLHTTQNFINQKPKFTSKLEGTDELPEDDIQLPKHVGAAK
jgi:hypothetical protein